MSIRPLIDYVLVKPDEQNKTKGGISLPDTAKDKDKPQIGTVVATGPGRRFYNQTYNYTLSKGGGVGGQGTSFSEMTVSKGDRVLFKKWTGHEVEDDGEKLLMVELENILGVIEEDTKN